MREIIITEQMAGGRLDKLLLKYLDKANSSFIYKMLRKKNIKLNQKKAAGNEILVKNDVISLYLAEETIRNFKTEKKKKEKQAVSAKPLPKGMHIFEDENLLVLNKPAGMLSQKARPSDFSLNDLVKSYLGSSELFTPGISNRLDRNTSGIVLIGKNPRAVRSLNEGIKSRALRKLYLTLVKGQTADREDLRAYLKKNETDNQVLVYQNAPADPAFYSEIHTQFQKLSGNDDYSLLQVDLITGKTHQIRAHLASIQHPVLGDPKYGDEKLNQRLKQQYHLGRQLLHAYRIEFQNMPGNLTYLNGSTLTAPLPEDFIQVQKGIHLCLPGDPEV